MEIYDKEPIQVLWEIFRELTLDELPVFKEVMTRKVPPDSYLLLRSQMSDTNEIFGDGEGIVRNSDNDAILVTKGFAEDTTDLHNVNKKKIFDLLKRKGIPYQTYNLGYDDTLKSTQQTFTIEVEYYG